LIDNHEDFKTLQSKFDTFQTATDVLKELTTIIGRRRAEQYAAKLFQEIRTLPKMKNIKGNKALILGEI
jgi:phosphatidate phosphatase PAH1